MQESDKFSIIAVDFDGTLCQDQYPDIGRPNEPLMHWIREMRNEGSKVILWTCRCGQKLEEAVEWCHHHNVAFDAVNENIWEIKNLYGSDARKIYADIYIDDRAYRNLEEVMKN